MLGSTASGRRLAFVATLAALVAVAGCSADDSAGEPATATGTAAEPDVSEATADDDVSPETTASEPSASDPPVSDAPATGSPSSDPPSSDLVDEAPPTGRDLSYLWNDADEMVFAWDGANAALDAQAGLPRIVLVADDLRIAPLQSAGDGFAAVDVFTAGFLSGTIDPGGEVSALVTSVDPSDETASAAVATSLAALVATWTEFGVDGAGFSLATTAAYEELANPLAAIGEQRFVRGPDGLTYVAVLSVIVHESTGRTMIEVAVIPLPDEAAALSVVELLRFELTSLTG